MSIKEQIMNDMKSFMKSKDMDRLGAIRLLQAAIKQKEIDEQIELDDSQVLTVIEKMLKQRKDSIEAFTKANRQDLVDKENLEVSILSQYMPEQISENELISLIENEINKLESQDMSQMGKVISNLKTQVAGRADMAKVSQLVRQKLA
ncbi:MAG: GatB/YqeY domain-containing protein [Nitrosomonadales bacterium]